VRSEQADSYAVQRGEGKSDSVYRTGNRIIEISKYCIGFSLYAG
jgi:hypothetical protein